MASKGYYGSAKLQVVTHPITGKKMVLCVNNEGDYLYSYEYIRGEAHDILLGVEEEQEHREWYDQWLT